MKLTSYTVRQYLGMLNKRYIAWSGGSGGKQASNVAIDGDNHENTDGKRTANATTG